MFSVCQLLFFNFVHAPVLWCPQTERCSPPPTSSKHLQRLRLVVLSQHVLIELQFGNQLQHLRGPIDTLPGGHMVYDPLDDLGRRLGVEDVRCRCCARFQAGVDLQSIVVESKLERDVCAGELFKTFLGFSRLKQITTAVRLNSF